MRSKDKPAINYDHDKRRLDQVTLVGTVGKELRELFCARVWTSKNSNAVVYASVWIFLPSKLLTGRGTAGGGGYDRAGAAVVEAITEAYRIAGMEVPAYFDAVTGMYGLTAALEVHAKTLKATPHLIING